MEFDRDAMVYRRDALAQGFDDEYLRRSCQGGALVRVRPGVYGDPRMVADLDAIAKHRMAISATVRATTTSTVVSHASAAVLHGLPLWQTPLRRVHLTIDKSGGGKTSSRRHVHAAPYGDDEVTVVDGIAVFGVARTVADIARTQPFESAVVVGDGALRDYGLTADRLLAAVERWPRRPGAGAARRAIRFMDARSESVGESRSRVKIFEAGLPAVTPQFEVRRPDGRFVGRVDFGMVEHGVVGEFDGRVKYNRLLRPGQSAGDVVYDEKLREDAIRDLGAQVVRWTWGDLDDFRETAERWRRAIERARFLPPPSWC